MKKLTLCLLVLLCGVNSYSQNSNQLIATWKLQKISYKRITASNEGPQDQFTNVFKVALYKQLKAEQQLDVYELDQLNAQAEELLKLFYQSEIEFQANSTFYNTSKMQSQISSGEYLLDDKRLLMEWETANKNTFKILKLNASEVVLMDLDLKIAFQYLKNDD